jgi:uncharacterized protein with PQ loop repeat
MAVFAAAVGAALSLSMTVPQVTVIWRDRSYAGVSVGAWMLLTLTASTWAGFSLRTGNAALGVGNVLFLLACWCLVLVTLRADRFPATRTVLTVLGSLLASGGAVLAGLRAPLVVVVVIGVAASFVRLPQVVQSFRTWSGAAPTEVSMMSLWIGFIGNCSWVLHGVFRADPFVTVAAALGLLVAGAIIGLELAAERQRHGLVKAS